MIYMAIVGFVMMILITILLLKKKVSPMFAFTIIPIVAAFLIGADVQRVSDYVSAGLQKTMSLMFIIFFALPYFSVVSDAGMFNDMVEGLLKRTKLSVTVVCIITVLVSMITQIDGSMTSTYLITIPMMMPLYKKLRMDPKVLLLLCSASLCALFTTPWSTKVLRAATLSDWPSFWPEFRLRKVPDCPKAKLRTLLCKVPAEKMAKIYADRNCSGLMYC